MSPVAVKTMRFLYKLVKNNLKRRHFRYKIGQKAVIQREMFFILAEVE